MEGAKLSKESDKRVRDMLCLHQVFRRVPNILFDNPDGKLWQDYENVVRAVLEDKNLNMDFQWKARIGQHVDHQKLVGGYTIGVAAVSEEVRPGNPWLEEALNMISLRPSVQDMEYETSIFTNAVKEYPLMVPRQALCRACLEIYVAIDRDLYLFISALDSFYGTEYVSRSLQYIIETREAIKEYKEAQDFIKTLYEKSSTDKRKALISQEKNAYTTVIHMNRKLQLKSCTDNNGNPVYFKDYKGIDATWADKRIPDDSVIEEYFAKGLNKLLEQAVGRQAMLEKGIVRYLALLDMVDKAFPSDKKNLLLFFTPEILYGFGYVKLVEGKFSQYVKPA